MFVICVTVFWYLDICDYCIGYCIARGYLCRHASSCDIP